MWKVTEAREETIVVVNDETAETREILVPGWKEMGEGKLLQYLALQLDPTAAEREATEKANAASLQGKEV